MSVWLLLNELSCPAPARRQPSQVDAAMQTFVGLLRQINSWRREAVLVSEVSLKDLELAPGYFMQMWVADDPRHRDQWRFIQSMRNRVPSGSLLQSDEAAEVEYRWHDKDAKALGVAHTVGGLLVSLLLEECWDAHVITATRIFLSDQDEDLHEETIEVKHAATLAHAAVHEEWVKSLGLSDLRRGDQIWEQRADLYPSLQFLPRVEDDLRRLKSQWVLPVATELHRIEEAVAAWDPTTRATPVWAHVTPEHEQRRQLCWFEDLDGANRLFDWHARFTPGKGRIHLRLVPEDRRVRIAYIGDKL
jgi:hypothetical protein